MRSSVLARPLVCFCLCLAACSPQEQAPAARAVTPVSGTLELDGLSAPVRVVRDRWGVPHIQAASRDDLFFAQGFVQASDRLFQMDLWRRASQGRLAEVLGSNFIGRDAMTRRVQYVGDLDAEWASYGPETRAIASAFVRGVNAWVRVARGSPPEPFRLAGWLPDLWRPEDLLNRTDAFLASGDGLDEVLRARLVTAVGRARASALLGDRLLDPGDADLAAVTFQVGDLFRLIGARPFLTALQSADGGSNAWAVAPRLSATKAPLVATDPHRPLTNPSLRYLVHLMAPGWNVIGATAPWMPGVSIGHNGQVAWGMTAYAADTVDLYIEKLNPDNPHQVEIDGRWQNTSVSVESLWVKGRSRPVSFQRELTPHGVVIGVDSERHLAFTLRWSGFEPGSAGELAAATLNRADSIDAFRAALAHWKAPAVDVIFADRSGAIGSQVAAHVPVRRGSEGKLPVAAWTGRSDWTGWQAIDALPRSINPSGGFVASANQNRPRTERLRAALQSDGSFSVADFERLQHDTLAWSAGRLVPLLAPLRSDRADVEQARQGLLNWDRRIAVDSTDSAVYVSWERHLRRMLVEPHVPAELVDEFLIRAHERLVPALLAPSFPWFTGDVNRSRNELLLRALGQAVDEIAELRSQQDAAGRDQVAFAHPLGITEATRPRFNLGPFRRPWYPDILMATSGRQPDAAVGAAFSAVFDLADWDRSVAMNAPGQAESPESPHFGDLVRLWAEGSNVPLPFSEAAIAQSAESTLTLVPRPTAR